MTKKPSDQPQDNLPRLSNPARRALATINVFQLEDLTTHTEAEIKKLHGMGPKGVRELNEALQQAGLSYAAKK